MPCPARYQHPCKIPGAHCRVPPICAATSCTEERCSLQYEHRSACSACVSTATCNMSTAAPTAPV
eukprot:146-Chlamydomonas_euryale.AAC.1